MGQLRAQQHETHRNYPQEIIRAVFDSNISGRKINGLISCCFRHSIKLQLYQTTVAGLINTDHMNFEYKHLLPEDFHPQSRVWIYQSSRLFSMGEALHIEEMMEDFVSTWQSHGAKVKGYANLFFGQFIIIMADETQAGVSGCSTDSSVRLIKDIEKRFGVDMFNRQSLAFIVKDKVQVLPLSQLNYAIENEFIKPETIYFNNLVQTKQEMEDSWLQPVKDSWLAKKLKVRV
jgi:hypothetical protein